MMAANASNTWPTSFFARPVCSATVENNSLLLRGLLAGVTFLGLGAAAFFAIVFSIKVMPVRLHPHCGGMVLHDFSVVFNPPKRKFTKFPRFLALRAAHPLQIMVFSMPNHARSP